MRGRRATGHTLGVYVIIHFLCMKADAWRRRSWRQSRRSAPPLFPIGKYSADFGCCAALGLRRGWAVTSYMAPHIDILVASYIVPLWFASFSILTLWWRASYLPMARR